LAAAGCFTEPKFENESIATRGSMPSRVTNLAVASRDLREGLGVGLDVHRRVGEEERLLAKDLM